ncbi:alpha tocopherol transfer protein [Echinococcus multilocularis]|uniref:Alpha tocopherol transfer protein n=1 Tax=Echinococcus multilocularis TaxID=6211 RepID=A0A0S4MJK9_ECHMU|nr:alpha tocopherol transfer protein [Echinococcus multilocularis]
MCENDTLRIKLLLMPADLPSSYPKSSIKKAVDELQEKPKQLSQQLENFRLWQFLPLGFTMQGVLCMLFRSGEKEDL